MNHLCDDARRALDFTEEERIQYILEERWVEYPAAARALRELTALLRHPKVHRMPNRLLISDTNNGKTSLLRRFVVLQDRSASGESKILLVQSPPTPERRSLFTVILDALKMPYAPSHKTDVLFNQVRTVVPKCGVRMLIIDEIQHIIAGDNIKQRALLNVIKYLSNEWRLPMVAAGTAEAYKAVRLDPQIANRFQPLELPRWRENREFQQLLQSFESLLPLRKPSGLVEPELRHRLSLQADGAIGELSTLLNAAAVEAIIGGEERITHPVLDRVPWIPASQRQGRAHVGSISASNLGTAAAG